MNQDQKASLAVSLSLLAGTMAATFLLTWAFFETFGAWRWP